MRPAAQHLADRIDRCIALQEELIELAGAQRSSLVGRRHEVIDHEVKAAESVVLQLAAAEAERQGAAEELADELGISATRWSALRSELEPDELAALGPRIDRLEVVVRELELANAVNTQVVMRELDIVDVQMRGLGSAEAPRVTRGYTDRGDPTPGQGAEAVLLNTSA